MGFFEWLCRDKTKDEPQKEKQKYVPKVISDEQLQKAKDSLIEQDKATPLYRLVVELTTGEIVRGKPIKNSYEAYKTKYKYTQSYYSSRTKNNPDYYEDEIIQFSFQSSKNIALRIKNNTQDFTVDNKTYLRHVIKSIEIQEVTQDERKQLKENDYHNEFTNVVYGGMYGR